MNTFQASSGIAGLFSALFLFTSPASAQENIPPTISITSPEDGARFTEPAKIVIETEVDDEDGTVKKVEFYSGSTKIGEDSIAGSGTASPPKHWHECGGFGTSTLGGLGGEVYKVTNLNNSGPGSFREAVSGNDRLVVFEVGGVIDLDNDDIRLGRNITIAGQTAPSPGITLIRANVSANGDNTVISHITILFGDDTDRDNDASNIRADNVVFDHVTASWSIDEVLSIHGVTNVTLYKCIIAEGLQHTRHYEPEHSKGSLINGAPQGLSLIGCLYAHNAMRNPRCDYGEIFIANQVNYNWTTGYDDPEPHWFDWNVHLYQAETSFVGNVALMGPESVGEFYLDGHLSSINWAYMDDNIIRDREGNDLQVYDTADFIVLDEPPLWPGNFEPLPAHESLYENLRTVGSRPGDRDTHNSRIVATVANGDGEVIDSQEEVGGYPVYAETNRSLTVPDGVEARQEWLDSFEDPIAVDSTIDLSRLYSLVGSEASDKLRSDTGYNFTWKDVPEGTYTLTAVATDNSGDTTTSAPVSIVVEYIPVTGLALDPDSATLDVGATTWLSLTIEPSGASNQDVVWASSDTSIATVSTLGMVTGIAVGDATISATTRNGNFSDSSLISVRIPVSNIELWPMFASLYVDSTIQLNATVIPEDATNQNVIWSSNDTSIASVDSVGLVTGLAKGTTTITVTSEQGSKTAACIVMVSANSTVSSEDNRPGIVVAGRGMIAYPNPVSGLLRVVLGKDFAFGASIELFDTSGRMVNSLKSDGSELSIDMKSLSPGLYLIKASKDGNSITQQIVKE